MGMKKGALMAMMGAMAMSTMDGGNPFMTATEKKELTPDELEAYEKLKAEKDIEKKIKQGQKPFEFGNVIIWARNEKNANRKAKNSGLI